MPSAGRLLVQQAQILIRMNRTKECAAALDKIPDDPLLRGDVSLLRGRLALAKARPEEAPRNRALAPSTLGQRERSGLVPLPKGEGSKEKFRSAIEWFRKAMSQDPGDNRVARQATYLIGLCLMEQGDLPAALNQMERTSRFFPETPEVLAALYQQGEIARRMGRHAEAVSAYQRLVSAYARQDEFHNPWVDPAQLKATLLGVCQEYLKAEKYETAVLLSKLLVHFMPKVEALQLTARIYRTWGDNLLEQAEHLPPERAEKLRRQARTQFRRAGDSYTAVARELYTTRQYPEQLWNSAGAYFAGHDFRNAAAMLRLYMRNESRLRHAQALVDLGEAELSLGETERALQSFQECIQQHPRDVAVYRARLLGQPGRDEHGRSEASRNLPAGQPQRRAIDPRQQGMARFALRPGRASAQRRPRSRGDPAPGRSVATLPRRPASDRRPLPAGRQFAAAGDGLAGGAGQGDFFRGPRRADAARAAACSSGPWRPTACCRTTSAAAMRRA